MNELIVIPEENIEIIMPSYVLPKSVISSRHNSITLFKTFATILVYLFVSVMALWFFGVFSGYAETGLTIVYVAMIVSAIVIKIIKSL